MNAALLRRLSALLLVAAPLAACGGSGGGNGLAPQDSGNPDPDTGADDAGTGDAADDSGSDDAATDGSAETDAGDGTGSTSFEEEHFFACSVDSDCGLFQDQEQICVNRVCVVPPRTPAILAEEWEEPNPNPDGDDSLTIGYVEERPDEAIDLTCYTSGSIYEPVDAPPTTSLTGIIERFGSGPATTGLCVTVFDETALLPWLINHECNLLADDGSLEAEFASCFQVDPCRCDEFFAGEDDGAIEDMIGALELALDEAGTPTSIDSVDACYGAIGYCGAVTDPEIRAACVARVQRLSLSTDAESLILGHTISTLNPDNEDAGVFTLEGIPSNFRFAYKVSGRENRWRDTWEYGLFSRGDLIVDGVAHIDANAVSAGAWRTIPPAVGFPGGIDDRNGAVAGAIRDCGTGERIPWNIVHGTVGIAFLDVETRLAYFNGNPNNKLPQPGRVDTDPLGLFAAINLPPGPNRVSPVICTANCNPDDPANTGAAEYTFAGGRNVFQTPKSVIIATFEGLY